ncbi:MAG: hypothetical protein ACOC8F_00015 [Planctomycetota bacterium]
MTRMRMAWLAAGAVLAMSVTAPGADDGIGQAELDKLVAQVEANAERWAERKGEDRSVDEALEHVTYGADSVAPLRRAMATPRKEPLDLYVANKLLQPLLRAPSEVVAQVIPSVQTLLAKSRLTPFPNYPESFLNQLKLPAKPDMPAEQVMARVAEIERRRKQKVEKDRKIAMHNAAAARLIRTGGKLLLYADQPRYDTEFVKLIAQQAKQKSRSFAVLLEALKAEVPKLPLRRARVYYGALKELGMRLRFHRFEYRDFTKPHIRVAANSSYGRQRGKPQWRYPGIELLEVVNLLAPKASQPGLNIPSKADVDKRDPDEK